jgi:putative Mg2+ transporter-C (MgtC) family protein
MDTHEISLRLITAALVGATLGLNRDIHGKPTGVRTLGLVGLASALAVLAFGEDHGDASRIMQGIVTGVGFLGAGVIVHGSGDGQVRGLTTAACVWLTACVGAACGAGEWQIILPSLPIIIALLVFGGQFEKAVRNRFFKQAPDAD